jgi:hypothetical protein
MMPSRKTSWGLLRHHLVQAMVCILLGLGHGSVFAGSIEPQSAALVADEHGQAVTAEFAIDLGPRLEDAVRRSVPLHFRFEFDLTRKRRYWMDEHVAGHVILYRLSYQALTRQFRLTLGSLHQNFETLEEALRTLGRVGRLHVIDKTALLPGETYIAAVRLSLDHAQLPKPLQVDALADQDWRIAATTLRWDFVPATEK